MDSPYILALERFRNSKMKKNLYYDLCVLNKCNISIQNQL